MSDIRDIAAAGYTITCDGRVFSASNWRGYGARELQQTPNADGYPSVRLTLGTRRVRLAVHKLVAMAHLPPRPGRTHQLRHLDGNKLHCAARNLAWGTAKDNADDRQRHGKTSRGPRHSARIKSALSARRKGGK
jgi:hypothetical protein